MASTKRVRFCGESDSFIAVAFWNRSQFGWTRFFKWKVVRVAEIVGLLKEGEALKIEMKDLNEWKAFRDSWYGIEFFSNEYQAEVSKFSKLQILIEETHQHFCSKWTLRLNPIKLKESFHAQSFRMNFWHFKAKTFDWRPVHTSKRLNQIF